MIKLKQLVQEVINYNSIDRNKPFDAKNQILLPSNITSKINKEFTAMGDYFEKIPMQTMFDILLKYDVIPLQEDYTYWDGFLTGRDGRATIELAYIDKVVKNRSLHFTWHKMEQSGKYECIKYVG